MGAKGIDISNEASPIVGEYFARKTLASIGFFSDLKDLDAVKAEAFCMISREVADAQRLENEKAMRARKHGRR